jgi:hypothetical protein
LIEFLVYLRQIISERCKICLLAPSTCHHHEVQNGVKVHGLQEGAKTAFLKIAAGLVTKFFAGSNPDKSGSGMTY